MTGMCYQVLNLRLGWAEAREECRYRGGWREDGDLAGINSLEEQTFLSSKCVVIFGAIFIFVLISLVEHNW